MTHTISGRDMQREGISLTALQDYPSVDILGNRAGFYVIPSGCKHHGALVQGMRPPQSSGVIAPYVDKAEFVGPASLLDQVSADRE